MARRIALRPYPHSLAIILTFAVTLLAVPTSALASCGEVTKQRADSTAWPKNRRAPLVIGDSTMVFAVPHIAERGMTADAAICRQFQDGVRMVEKLHKHKRMPPMIVIALGANGSVPQEGLRSLRSMVGPKRELVLVTPKRFYVPSDRTKVFSFAKRKKNVTVLDWDRYSSAHPAWFGGDGLHVTPEGGRKMAKWLDQHAMPIALRATNMVMTANGPRPKQS